MFFIFALTPVQALQLDMLDANFAMITVVPINFSNRAPSEVLRDELDLCFAVAGASFIPIRQVPYLFGNDYGAIEREEIDANFAFLAPVPSGGNIITETGDNMVSETGGQLITE